MGASAREEVRRGVSTTRRAPGSQGPGLVREGGTRSEDGYRDGSPPVEIWLDVACGGAESPSWQLPDWLEAEVHRWADEEVLLGVTATNGCLPCDEAWQCLCDTRGTAAGWRLVLRTDGRGMASMAAIHRVLSGPFDEVHLVTGRNGRGGERVLIVMKQLVELRGARGQDAPSVVWLYETPATPESGRPDPIALRDARSRARQIGVDRFEAVSVAAEDPAGSGGGPS